MPFNVSFLREGSLTKIDYRKKGTLILSSLLEDLVLEGSKSRSFNGNHQEIAIREIRGPLCGGQ